MHGKHLREVDELELERFAVKAIWTDAWQRNPAKCAHCDFIALQHPVAGFAATRKKQVGEITEELFQVHFCVL